MSQDFTHLKHPWCFHGNMPVSANTKIEIRGMRFDYIQRVFEAREVYDTSTQITYRVEGNFRFYQLPWQQIILSAHINNVTIEDGKTMFSLFIGDDKTMVD